MTETLSVRIVRTVHQVLPRWLTGKEVTDACRDENGNLVYSNLSNLSKDSKGPLRKQRNNGGVYEYSTIEGFNFEEWLDARRVTGARRSKGSPEAGDNLDVCIRIIQTLRAYSTRLTAADLLGTEKFPDDKALRLGLALLCDEGQPLERERVPADGPFQYGIRRDFDIDAWLKEHGDDAAREPATPPVSGSAAPSKEGAEPVRVAATKTVALQMPDAAKPRDGTPPPAHASAVATAPKTAAPQAPMSARLGSGAAEADSRNHLSQPGKLVKVEPAPSVKDTRVAAPAAAAAPKGDSFDIATEIALVAAANLAVMLHDFDLPPDVVRALSTFERAFAMQGRVQKEARA